VSLHTVAVAYALIFLFTQLRTALDSASQSAGWLGRWAASNLLATALPVCFLALFPAFFKALTPGSYVALLAVAGALSIGASLALYFEAVGGWKALRPDPSILGQIASAGRGPWLALLTNTMAASGVPTLIAAFLPSKELGYFSVAVSLYLWISGAGMAVTVPAMWDWARLAAAHDLQAVKKDLRRRQRATGIVMTSAALVMFVGAGPIVRTLYGQDFAPAVPMVRLVALNVVMTGFGSWYWHMFLALGQSGRVAVPNIASNIPSLGLAYVFLRFTNWGATGAILAGVIGGAFWIGAYELELRAALRQEKRRAGVMPH
jgi:O-antigen/teichoic acid export membrane protein